MAGNPRKQGAEQYYTIDSVAKHFTDILIGIVGKDHTFLEPTAGGGSFLRALQEAEVKEILAYDIEPRHPDVVQADFLSLNLDKQHLIAVGNPPFGRACALAIKTFNKCAESCDVIAFIIPPSFRKPSIEDRLHPEFVRVYTEQCPEVSFQTPEGVVYEMGRLRTEFQIWQRVKGETRPKRQSYRSDKFKFVKKDENPDLAFRTHGDGAGRILKGLDYNPRTTAFIKLIDERAKEALQKADYSYWMEATSHIPCIAPAEISLSVDEWYNNNPI